MRCLFGCACCGRGACFRCCLLVAGGLYGGLHFLRRQHFDGDGFASVIIVLQKRGMVIVSAAFPVLSSEIASGGGTPFCR